MLKEGVRWLGHVTKHIGEVPIKDITPQMIESTYAAIREERGLSGTSMNHIHILLKSVFQKAIAYDYSSATSMVSGDITSTKSQSYGVSVETQKECREL